MTVQFWFEFASTYSYPAAMRFEREALQRGVAFEWKPFVLGPIFAAQGWSDSPFNLYPAKGRYMWRDLERICRRLGLAYARPQIFPQNSVLAARVACIAAGDPWCGDYVRAVYRANFAERRDISRPEVVRACLQASGAPEGILEQVPERKGLLRANTAEAQRRGVFGAPTFLAGKELFWGQDRLEEALEWVG